MGLNYSHDLLHPIFRGLLWVKARGVGSHISHKATGKCLSKLCCVVDFANAIVDGLFDLVVRDAGSPMQHKGNLKF